MVDQMKARTQDMLQGALQEQAPAPRGMVGYNPETKEFFSAGRVFKADLNEGRQALVAGLFDAYNDSLPPGFLSVSGEQAKAKLAKDFESQGLLSDLSRRSGQFVASAGSTLRDLGVPGAQAIEQYGAGVAARNPSQISTAGDILDKPLTAAGEAVGEAGFDIAKAFATGAVGAKAGAAAGSVFGPAGASIGAILGGAGGIFLPSLFETYGSVRREQREQGIDDKGRALVAGAGSAALESALGPEAAVGRILTKKAGAVAARDLLQGGAAKAIGKGVVTGAITEGPLTEVPQSAIERYGAYKPLTGEEALNEYLISGFKGAVGGGAMSTITSSIEYQQAKNFADNFVEDQRIAADPMTPGPVRLQAARRVQAVLQGASDDPQFNQQLQEFRQKIQLLESRMASIATTEALKAGTPLNLIQDRPAFFERGAEQVETEKPADLSAYEAPAPLGREPRRPVIAEPAGPLQQVETTRPEDIQGPPVDEMSRLNAVLDLAGLSPFGTPGTLPSGPDTTLGGFEARPVQAPVGPVTPATGDLTTLGGFEYTPPTAAPALTPTQENFQSLLQGLPSLDLGAAPAPAAPAPATMPAAEPLVQVETKRPPSPAVATTAAGVSPTAPRGAVGLSLVQETAEDTAALQREIEAATSTKFERNPLAAAVEGAASVPVPGRPSLPTSALRQIRSILLNPETAEGAPARLARIAQAVRDFARTSATSSNAFANAARTDTLDAMLEKPGQTMTPAQIKGRQQRASRERGERALSQAAATQAALARLGEAVGNNPKDVELLVRMVKDTVQRRLHEGKSDDFAKYFKKIDSVLSATWAAAKRGKFLIEGDIDILDTRQGALRMSNEEKSAKAKGDLRSPLQKAAEDGFATYGRGEVQTGVFGVLNRIRTGGSDYAATLAKALKKALEQSPDDLPSIVFSETAKPSYDPKSNTITLRPEESESVVLHEVLHSVLQWYVYNNPKAETVVQLKKSLKQVVNFKGDLPSKAKEVQNLLKGLVASGNELDAILELVSYGNTLNDFRKALDAMPSKGVPASFRESVDALWNGFITLVKTLLGARDTVARDVIATTFKLLEETTTAATPLKRTGNVLEAAITADEFDTVPQEKLLQRPGASVPTDVDLSRFNKRIVPKVISTEFVFNMLGWSKMAAKGEAKVASIADAIRKDFPGLTRWISYVNARFGVPQDVRGIYEQYKDDRQAGYKLTERLATYVQFQPPEKVTALFAYLDGDKSALKGDEATRELADEVRRWRDFYVQELGNDKAKEFFARGKFSETMLFAADEKQIAGSTFGARSLNQLLGQKTKYEENFEDSWMNLDAVGDPVLTGQFYEVFRMEGTDKVHQGFIARDVFDRDGAPAGFYVDREFVWYHTGKNKNGHKFVANMTAAQALEAKRTDDLANALRNTMASLAGNYATLQFANSLANYGRAGDSKGMPPVAFDSVADIKAELGITVAKEDVLSASSAAARSAVMRHEYRSPNLWVQLPKGPQYGALSGKIVSGSVWSAMTDMSDRQPMIKLNALNNTMRWFKKSKTVYNFGTHVTNVATNFTLAMMHDIPMPTVAHAAKLFAQYEVNPNAMSPQDRQLVLAFINSNAMVGDFSSAEVKQALYDAMKQSLDGGSPSLLGRLSTMAGFEKGKAEAIKRFVGNKLDKADQVMTEIYSAEDNIFRLAAFLKHAADLSAQRGGQVTAQDLQAAGDFARWAFLDYDIDSKAVRIARQTVLPFVSWTYAIIPVLGKIAVHQPWKIANLLLAYTILEHVMQAMAGEEEDELARKRGPEYIRDRMFGFGPYMHVRIPFLGDDQNPVYYRLGDYIPMASLARGLPNGFMGQDWWPSAVTPTGPFVTSVIASLAGVDPYTGKPLSPPTEDMWGKFVDRGQVLAGQFVPPPVADFINWTRVEDIYKGRTDKTESYAALQFARWGGLKLYDFNVDQAAQAQSRAAKAIMSEYKQEISRLKRAEARFENPDWEGFRAKQQELLERMQEEMAKAKGEE